MNHMVCCVARQLVPAPCHPECQELAAAVGAAKNINPRARGTGPLYREANERIRRAQRAVVSLGGELDFVPLPCSCAACAEQRRLEVTYQATRDRQAACRHPNLPPSTPNGRTCPDCGCRFA